MNSTLPGILISAVFLACPALGAVEGGQPQAPAVRDGGTGKTSPIPQPVGQTGHAELIQLIGPELVYADRTRKPTGLLAQPEYVVLYLSAHWCPPCRKFSPELVRQYRELKQAGASIEVVFISRDEDADHQFGYMQELAMPWPAAPLPRVRALLKKYGGRGIPNVIVLDRNDQVVSQSYAGERYQGPQKPIDDLKKLLK